jgi:hypothetical protein
MRKSLFWLGWGVLLALPIAFVAQGLIIQDLPKVALWQWFVPLAAIVLIYVSRNTDDVLKHHVV